MCLKGAIRMYTVLRQALHGAPFVSNIHIFSSYVSIFFKGTMNSLMYASPEKFQNMT